MAGGFFGNAAPSGGPAAGAPNVFGGVVLQSGAPAPQFAPPPGGGIFGQPPAGGPVGPGGTPPGAPPAGLGLVDKLVGPPGGPAGANGPGAPPPNFFAGLFAGVAP